MLSTEQAYAFGAELHGLGCVFRRFGVGANLQTPQRIAKFHESYEVFIILGAADHRQCSLIGTAFSSIERNNFTFAHRFTGDCHYLLMNIYMQGAGADNTAFTPAAGNESGVRGHAAARRKDTLCRAHAFDIFGISLLTH